MTDATQHLKDDASEIQLPADMDVNNVDFLVLSTVIIRPTRRHPDGPPRVMGFKLSAYDKGSEGAPHPLAELLRDQYTHEKAVSLSLGLAKRMGVKLIGEVDGKKIPLLNPNRIFAAAAEQTPKKTSSLSM